MTNQVELKVHTALTKYTRHKYMLGIACSILQFDLYLAIPFLLLQYASIPLAPLAFANHFISEASVESVGLLLRYLGTNLRTSTVDIA